MSEIGPPSPVGIGLACLGAVIAGRALLALGGDLPPSPPGPEQLFACLATALALGLALLRAGGGMRP
jgi:hypothetical protein